MIELFIVGLVIIAAMFALPTIYSDYRKHHPKLAAH